jgi:hypothetical protein
MCDYYINILYCKILFDGYFYDNLIFLKTTRVYTKNTETQIYLSHKFFNSIIEFETKKKIVFKFLKFKNKTHFKFSKIESI